MRQRAGAPTSKSAARTLLSEVLLLMCTSISGVFDGVHFDIRDDESTSKSAARGSIASVFATICIKSERFRNGSCGIIQNR